MGQKIKLVGEKMTSNLVEEYILLDDGQVSFYREYSVVNAESRWEDYSNRPVERIIGYVAYNPIDADRFDVVLPSFTISPAIGLHPVIISNKYTPSNLFISRLAVKEFEDVSLESLLDVTSYVKELEFFFHKAKVFKGL